MTKTKDELGDAVSSYFKTKRKFREVDRQLARMRTFNEHDDEYWKLVAEIDRLYWAGLPYDEPKRRCDEIIRKKELLSASVNLPLTTEERLKDIGDEATDAASEVFIHGARIFLKSLLYLLWFALLVWLFPIFIKWLF